MTTIEDANFALQKVRDAGSQKSVIELAWIKNVRVTIPRVIVTLSLPSIFSSPEQILSCRVNKRFLVFSLELLGGSFNMYLVNLEEKNFFG